MSGVISRYVFSLSLRVVCAVLSILQRRIGVAFTFSYVLLFFLEILIWRLAVAPALALAIEIESTYSNGKRILKQKRSDSCE